MKIKVIIHGSQKDYTEAAKEFVTKAMKERKNHGTKHSSN